MGTSLKKNPPVIQEYRKDGDFAVKRTRSIMKTKNTRMLRDSKHRPYGRLQKSRRGTVQQTVYSFYVKRK